jgi:hypothetical protein
MHPRVRVVFMTLALRCLLALLFALSFGELCCAAPPTNEPREWTDRQGRKITARLEKVKGRNVVLNVDGDLVTVPLSQLSDADRAFVRGDAPAAPQSTTASANDPARPQEVTAEPRAWRVHQRQVIGVLVGADDRGFELLVNDRPMRVGYEVLVDEEDVVALVNHLTLVGRGELAELAIATYESNTGKKYPRPGDAANSDPMPKPTEADEPEEPEEPAAPEVAATDTVIEIVPPVLPSPPPAPKFKTADQVLNQAQTPREPSKEELKKFEQTTMSAAFVLVSVVAAVITYGWMTLRRNG